MIISQEIDLAGMLKLTYQLSNGDILHFKFKANCTQEYIMNEIDRTISNLKLRDAVLKLREVSAQMFDTIYMSLMRNYDITFGEYEAFKSSLTEEELLIITNFEQVIMDYLQITQFDEDAFLDIKTQLIDYAD